MVFDFLRRPGRVAPEAKASATGPVIAYQGSGRVAWSARDVVSLTKTGFLGNPIGFRAGNCHRLWGAADVDGDSGRCHLRELPRGEPSVFQADGAALGCEGDGISFTLVIRLYGRVG